MCCEMTPKATVDVLPLHRHFTGVVARPEEICATTAKSEGVQKHEELSVLGGLQDNLGEDKWP